jgi:hypothetical protein
MTLHTIFARTVDDSQSCHVLYIVHMPLEAISQRSAITGIRSGDALIVSLMD